MVQVICLLAKSLLFSIRQLLILHPVLRTSCVLDLPRTRTNRLLGGVVSPTQLAYKIQIFTPGIELLCKA